MDEFTWFKIQIFTVLGGEGVTPIEFIAGLEAVVHSSRHHTGRCAPRDSPLLATLSPPVWAQNNLWRTRELLSPRFRSQNRKRVGDSASLIPGLVLSVVLQLHRHLAPLISRGHLPNRMQFQKRSMGTISFSPWPGYTWRTDCQSDIFCFISQTIFYFYLAAGILGVHDLPLILHSPVVEFEGDQLQLQIEGERVKWGWLFHSQYFVLGAV